MALLKTLRLNLWNFVWIAVVLSVLLSLLLSELIHGYILLEYPFSAAIIGCMVAAPLIYLIKRLQEGERTLAEHHAQEVTERLKTEMALRESQARFSCAFHDAAIGMALVGLDGQWLQVNSALCELVGYTEQQLLGNTFQAITHPDDLDADLSVIQQMLKGDIRTCQMEKRYFHKRGHVVWILLTASLVRDSSGQPHYFISQIQDITERKHIQDQLTTSQLLFRALLDNSPNMIFLKDTEGRYVLVNRQFETQFHLDGAAIVGKTDDEIFSAPQAASFQANDRKVLQAGVPMEFEELALHDDGPHTSIVFKFPLRNKDRDICWIGGITADITERKRAEEALRDSEQRLRHAFEERERLSQNLHDHVIQSIYAIGMALETCVYLVDKDTQGVAHKLQKGIADLNAVITQLRDYIEGGSSNTIKAEQLCEALEEFIRTIPRTDSFALQLQLEPIIANELTDSAATHILHIVREALSNTLRHAKATSSKVTLRRTDEGLHLDVQDDGVGFDLEAHDGSGWGLRNMAARAARLNAKFYVISGHGRGTHISLDIPRSDHARPEVT